MRNKSMSKKNNPFSVAKKWALESWGVRQRKRKYIKKES